MITETNDTLEYSFSPGAVYPIPKSGPGSLKYWNTSELKIYTVKNGAETLLNSSQYWIDSAGLVLVNVEDVDSVVIRRKLPYTQDTQYINGAPINGRLIERNFDRLTVMVQQVEKGMRESKSDWNETDPTSPKYIRNKPTKLSDFENDLPAVETEYDKAVDLGYQGTRQDFVRGLMDNVNEISFSASVGDGRTSYLVNHGLNTERVIVTIAANLGALPTYEIEITDENNVLVAFSEAIDDNAAQVIVRRNDTVIFKDEMADILET